VTEIFPDSVGDCIFQLILEGDKVVEVFMASLVLGAVAGLSAGLFGIGGGLFSHYGIAADLVMIMSVATSLATIICTSIASVWSHHRLGAVVWAKVFQLVPGIIVGSVLGAIVAEQMPKSTLRVVFIVYLLYAAISMARGNKPAPGRAASSKCIDAIAGVITGSMSAIIGIGGGTLIVPFLVYFQMPIRNAVAVASACGLPIAMASTVSYAVLGWSVLQLPAWSVGYVYLPAFFGIALTSVLTAPIGAKLVNRIPALQLKRYFSIVLFIMVVKLLWPYVAQLSGNITTRLHL
jgi:uncharacterized protein